MIAVDTNLLVYAHRRDSAWHEPAFAAIKQLAEGAAAWAIPWPCVHEFLALVTPTLVLLTEGAGHWDALRAVGQNGRVTGPQVHDARVAALCVQHGVREIWTADRDFSRFPKLRTRNPLVG